MAGGKLSSRYYLWYIKYFAVAVAVGGNYFVLSSGVCRRIA
jgi:hypothetical protein